MPGRGRGRSRASDTVKGYEYAPGEYVVITDEDLENVPLKTVRSIEIEQFTKAERDDANVRFVKSAYYLEPDKIGRKAFYLLKSVLEDEGLTAICKVVIKDREALAAIDPFGDTMLLTTLHWPDEIRSTAELDLGDEDFEFKPAELKMAKQLVAAMTGEFDPAQYKDEYREALETIIQAKVEGKETVAVEAPEESGKLIDLMAALEASVNAAKAARDSSGDKPVSVSDAKAAKAGRAAASKAKADDGGRGDARQARPEAQDRLTAGPPPDQPIRCHMVTRASGAGGRTSHSVELVTRSPARASGRNDASIDGRHPDTMTRTLRSPAIGVP